MLLLRSVATKRKDDEVRDENFHVSSVAFANDRFMATGSMRTKLEERTKRFVFAFA